MPAHQLSACQRASEAAYWAAFLLICYVMLHKLRTYEMRDAQQAHTLMSSVSMLGGALADRSASVVIVSLVAAAPVDIWRRPHTARLVLHRVSIKAKEHLRRHNTTLHIPTAPQAGPLLSLSKGLCSA